MAKAVSEEILPSAPAEKLDKKEVQEKIKSQLSAYESRFVEMSKKTSEMIEKREEKLSNVLDMTMIYLEKNSLEKSLLEMISAAVSAGMNIKKDLIWYKPPTLSVRNKWGGFSLRTVLEAKYNSIGVMVNTLLQFKDEAAREIGAIKAEISAELKQGEILKQDIEALKESKDIKKKLEKSRKILDECDKLLDDILKKCENVSKDINTEADHLKKLKKHVAWQFKICRRIRGGTLRKWRVKRLLESWEKENSIFEKYLKSMNSLFNHFKEEVKLEKKLSKKQEKFLKQVGFQDDKNIEDLTRSFGKMEDRSGKYQNLIKRIRKLEGKIKKKKLHVIDSKGGKDLSDEMGRVREEISLEGEEIEQMIDLIGVLMRFERLLYNTEAKHLVVEEGIVTMLKWIDNAFETLKRAVKESKPIGEVVSKLRENVENILDRQINELMRVAEMIENELGEHGEGDIPGASKIVHDISNISRRMEDTIDKLSTNSTIMTDIKDKLRKSAEEQKKCIDEQIRELEKAKKEAEEEAKREEKELKKTARGAAKEKLGNAFARFKKMAKFDRSQVTSRTDQQINELIQQRNQIDPPVNEIISKIDSMNFGIQDIRAFSSIMEHLDVGKKSGEVYKQDIENVEKIYKEFKKSLAVPQISKSVQIYLGFLTTLKRSLDSQMVMESRIISMFTEFGKAQESLQNFLNNTSETPARLSEISSLIGNIGFIGDEVAEAVKSAIEETNQVSADMHKLANYNASNMDAIKQIIQWFNSEVNKSVKKIMQELDKSISAALRTRAVAETFTGKV